MTDATPKPVKPYARIASHPAATLIGRAPDDVCAALIGATTEGVAARRRTMGLDRPDPVLWQDDHDLVEEVLSIRLPSKRRAALARLMPLPDAP